VLLLKFFGVMDLVLAALIEGSEDIQLVRDIRTRDYIVERARNGLAMLKACRSAKQREQYYVCLGLLVPEPKPPRVDPTGMGRRVRQQLHVQQNRPPWQRSMAQRARAEAAWLMHDEPLVAGDAAISHGRECTIAEIDYEKNTCVLDFTAGGVQGSREFKAIGKEKGGARLSRPAISFYPEDAARRQRKDAKAEEARKDVEALFDAEGARSPSMRDEVRCRKGVGLYEVAQALIVCSTYAALYTLFIVQYPMHKISFSIFKALRPWYVRRAKREMCQCKHCENSGLYMQVLKTLPVLFDPVINPPTGDAEVDEDDGANADGSAAQPHRASADAWASSERLRRLIQFCNLTSKTEMVKACLCKGALEENKEKCIRGECRQCGFKKIWSEGLKFDVVNPGGNIYESAPIEFQSTLKWEKVTSTKQTVGSGLVNACAACPPRSYTSAA
jgi:hypothetical protein